MYNKITIQPIKAKKTPSEIHKNLKIKKTEKALIRQKNPNLRKYKLD
jgi:hypothetical protein